MNIINIFKDGKSELALVVVVISILMLLFVPISPGLLDFLILSNFSLALVILLMTLYTDKPLSFSTFPSLILIATLFRLGLNISSTRLILNDAAAGKVIGAIGAYVVGGNYVIGMVVFLILIVVQYVVVTNGAQRVAEVAARFTLDSMPGKQMSIDADLNMGLIDEVTAKNRRLEIEREASFYGAMDGSTKFVKGDSIAGIIIIIINILGGLIIGVAQHGLSWGDSLHTFTLLTVGDGIVTQIPSLIIATATGIIITRAASDSKLGKELSGQISSQPSILVIVSISLGLCVFMPGLPMFQLILLMILVGMSSLFVIRKTSKINDEESKVDLPADKNSENKHVEDVYDLLRCDSFEVLMSQEVSDFISDSSNTLKLRLETYRKQFAKDFGLVLPEEKLIADGSREANSYEIRVHGARFAQGYVHSKKLLAIGNNNTSSIEGIKTLEPTFGLPARWIDENQRSNAKSAGYTVVDPETTLLTHITETLKKSAPEMITRLETERMVRSVERTHSKLIEELIPTVLTYSEIQNVLQELIQERVSVRNLILIFETLIDTAKQDKSISYLVIKVREKLKNHICNELIDEKGMLNLITMDPRLEKKLAKSVSENNRGVPLSIDSITTEYLLKSLSSQVENMLSKRIKPALMCNVSIRRSLFLFCERAIPQLSVLSINEIPTNVNVKSFAMINDFKESA